MTNKAVEDLCGIWDYTFNNWSELQADKYYSLLLEVYQDIANNPESGKNYEEITKELLGLKAKNAA
ncbi:type II toxin-antitoxin system RelE/ParE family toxin [Marinilabilia salmonicolor]|uniref:type II toxin-antitoxin system RelE/ParE family toxin n=1 Tax=Marinilabilia salmonicolor TaxID=989 RepID=UPI00029ACAE3|nr:type II toxin-antitoxin system RelE/ParE family toxin [Marinilabilia salmonicolor]